jgi:seryl-tRNA synthetase
MTTTIDPSELDQQRRTFREELIGHGWLLTSRSTALPGLGPAPVAVYDGLSAFIARITRQEYTAGVTPVQFPHVFSARMLEQTDYVASFPQLLGTINSFLGDQKDFRRLIEIYDAGEDWQASLAPTGLALTSAACHPLYAWLENSTVDDAAIYELTGDCFRHEPSDDPMRFVTFRMREYVRLGTEEQAKAHRSTSLDISKGIFESLGLDVEIVAANDPFFGRGGVVLANNQLAAQAKFELVTEVYRGTETAIGSANYHDTHFGDEFTLSAPDGSTAHSACSAYGMDRIVLALARRHGFDLGAWPQQVRSALAIAD